MPGIGRRPFRALLLALALEAPGLAAGPTLPAAVTPGPPLSAAVEKLLNPAKEFNVIVFVPEWFYAVAIPLRRWETALDDYGRLHMRVITAIDDAAAAAYGLKVAPTVLFYRRGQLMRVDEGTIVQVNGRPRLILYVDDYLAPVLKGLGGPAVRLPGESEWLATEGKILRDKAARESAAALETEKLKELERRLAAPAAVLVEPGQGLPTAEEAFRLPWAAEGKRPQTEEPGREEGEDAED